jgi:hypothetical protein
MSSFLMSFWNTITNYMERVLSSKAKSGSACQEIPRISWKLKIPYRFHNISPLDSSLSQINPLHALAVEEHNRPIRFWSFVASELFMLYSEFRSKSINQSITRTHTHIHYIQPYIYIYTRMWKRKRICGNGKIVAFPPDQSAGQRTEGTYVSKIL